jgi:hypothetical protein
MASKANGTGESGSNPLLEQEKKTEEMLSGSHNYARFLKRMGGIRGQRAWGDMRGQSRLSSAIWSTEGSSSTSGSTVLRTTRGVVACIAVLGVAGVGGLAAGLTARAGLTTLAALAPGAPGMSSTVAATIADMAPSDIVNLRFPADWTEAVAAVDATTPLDPQPRTLAFTSALAFASADGGVPLFSSRPLYPIPETNSPPPPVVEVPVKPVGQPKVEQPKMALASVSSKPAVVAPNKPAVRSSAVLNDSQIASIKKRLALTPDQERYWPAVEAELRKMEYKKDKSGQGTRTAQVDLSKVNVEGLKSAGFPLVMSFSDDQRRELKSLAHLLGLEGVMSSL